MIGTWAAVALALIALIGVIPIYVWYRRKMTTWAKEIAKVDDPHRDFITRGWPGILGQIFFSRAHVPNLLDPPDIHRIGIKRRKCPDLWPRNSQSRTGWVNFLNILRSYDTLKPDSRSDGELEMVGGELVLPLHRSWILLVDLIDRYSSRQDHGLLSGESREPQVRLRFDSRAMSGLSGVLSLETSDRNEEQASPHDVICFHMHRLSQIHRLSSEINDGEFSPKTLLFLSLGYILSADGNVYTAEPPRTGFSMSRVRTGVWELREAEKHMLPQHHEEAFEEFGINIPKMRVLQTRRPTVEESKLQRGRTAEYYGIVTEGSWISIRRTDANAVLRAVMGLGCNSQSFLYARGDVEKGLLSILGRKGLKSSILRALEGLHDGNQGPLQAGMDKSLKSLSENRQPDSWSCSVWTKLSDLHKSIMGSYSEEERSYLLPITILFSLDEVFRKFVKSLDSKPAEERKRGKLILDFARNVVKVRGLAGTDNPSFLFNFAEFFRGSEWIPSSSDGFSRPKDVPYANVAIACLSGHIVMAMWSMCISAKNLSDLYTNMEPTVYVTSHTLPCGRRSKWDREYSPVRQDRHDNEYGDWSDETMVPDPYELASARADRGRAPLGTLREATKKASKRS